MRDEELFHRSGIQQQNDEINEWIDSFLVHVNSTANGYTCLEKLTTEKCKQQAKQPEKKILKIKIL